MKKKLIAILLCVLLTSISIGASAYQKKIEDTRLNAAEELIEFSSDPADAPEWAAGNFTGTWGLNIWGHDWFPIGQIQGYYGKGFLWNYKFGRFIIEYKENDNENGTKLEGLFIGPYLLGRATQIPSGNTSEFVGLGGYNETHFRWRIMGIEGPTLFMKGTFNQF